MTPQILLVLIILAVAVILFVSEKLRVDVVALMVLVSLALTGLVEPKQALSGFSNPAVITVWAVFILSGGLARTGVAGLLGRQVLRLAGTGEVRLIALIMLTAGFLSAFMNNVGVAALLLPVVMDISKRTRRAPSKLLIPLAFSCLLGGLTTLIGTPPNILIADALRERGMATFDLFDFAPVGGGVLLAGIVYMALIGRRLLPDRNPARHPALEGGDLRQVYSLSDQLSFIQIPADSSLDGRTLAESRLGSALGLNVFGIFRKGQAKLAPGPDVELKAGDRLLVEGGLDRLSELASQEYLEIDTQSLEAERLVAGEIELVEVQLAAPSPLLGKTLQEMNFRQTFGGIVLAIRRGGKVIRTHLESEPVQEGDLLLVQGLKSQLDQLREAPHLLVTTPEDAEAFQLEERLMVAKVPHDSPLAGRTLIESRLGDAFGIGVLGIVREGATHLMPEPGEKLMAGDTLLIKSKREDLGMVKGLRGLRAERGTEADLGKLETEQVGLAEVVLAPRSGLAGKTLRRLHFREKYGLNVVAISRGGQILRHNLRDTELRFGDALLLYGARQKLVVLGSEPDFLVLTEEAQAPVEVEKAPVAALLMGAVVLSVLVGWLPIYIAAVTGALGMVLTRCLSIDDAYRAIEWRAVFLIAGMLPLGIAMEQTGAATFLTELVISGIGGYGPLAIVAGLYLTTALGAQVMPTSAVAILMAPIALNTAAEMGLSPYALLMTVALSASASFMSPVAHPANVLIMGPGGYKFGDYIKVGLPLTLCCLVVVLILLPIVWPLNP